MIPVIETIPLQQLASGDRLSLQLYKFVGAQPGKKAYLQSNLHGNEIAGNVVMHHLIQFLMTLDETQLVGEIWLVPVCNPTGTNQRSLHYSTGRFNPYDGKDWNRIFWNYELPPEELLDFARCHLDKDVATIQQNYRQHIRDGFKELEDKVQSPAGVPFTDKYRYQLQSLCLDADYVIDLHTSVDQGLEYVYYFRDRQDSAHLFCLGIAVLLDTYDGDAFDEAFLKPWLALEDCFAKLDRPIKFDIEAWTLELGAGMQINPNSVSVGLLGVKTYLATKGLLALPEGDISNQIASASSHYALNTQFSSRTQMQRYYAPTGGVVQSRSPVGTTIKAGNLLYQLLNFNKDGKLPTTIDVKAAHTGLVFDVAANQSVNEGEYVIGILVSNVDDGR